MYDVLVVCTHFSQGEAATRRLIYFMNFLLQHKLSVGCLGSIVIPKGKIRLPISQCMIGSLIISMRSMFVHIINTLLSLPTFFYIIVLRPKIVLMSVPDHFPLLPVFIGTKIVGSKLVIDFRDPIEATYGIHLTGNKIGAVIAKFIIKVVYSICHRADAVIAVTKSLANMLKNYADIKAIVVPNGADLRIFKKVHRSLSRQLLGLDNNVFVIAYAGMIGAYHDLSEFMIMIQRLNKLSSRDIKLLLAGPIVDEKHRRLINSPLLKGMITYLGELSTEELVVVLSASDVGVTPLTSSSVFDYAVPVKFYEYIAIGLPVLTLCNENSELWRIVSENNLGLTCRPGDKVCIMHSLEDLMSEEVYSRLKANVENYKSKIDRTIGARILLVILRHMLHEG
ncbi:MAG: glycosyltransferase [Thermofilaceae archaeon]